MKAKYPKFLRSKVLVLGLRIDDVYFISGGVFLMGIFDMPQIFLAIYIVSYIFVIGIMRRLFPRDHVYFWIKSLQRENWHLSIKEAMHEGSRNK